MVVVDTCALIELCSPEPSFSASSIAAMEKESHVLSVSFAEIALKLKLKKLILDITAEEILRNLEKIPAVKLISIGCQEWFDAIHLAWDNKDPADRLITAYARRMNSPIVTTDKAIKKYWKQVMW